MPSGLGDVIEFAAPTEESDCAICKMSDPARVLIALGTADFGTVDVVDREGHSHRMMLEDSGEGGITELLASMRRRAKEQERPGT